MDYETIAERWNEEAKIDDWMKTDFKEQLSKIGDEGTLVSTCLILENQKLFNTAISVDSIIKTLYLNLIADFYPNLLHHKLVQVAPMLGPAALVFYLKENTIQSEQILAKTRRLYVNYTEKETDFSSSDIKPISNLIKEDFELELLNDLLSSSNEAKLKVDEIQNLKNFGNWAVVNGETYDLYKKELDDSKIAIHVVKYFPYTGILVGHRGEKLFDCNYVWCPYVLLAPVPTIPDFATRPGMISRYGKRLFSNQTYTKIAII